jgi:CRP/FNR family cyclic AMP-dependent transcriptional regulator
LKPSSPSPAQRAALEARRIAFAGRAELRPAIQIIRMNHDERREGGPQSILARLDGGKSALEYQRDQVVYSQGEPADCVFYVRAGTIKAAVISEAGKQAVVAILRPGHFCGEDCLIGHELRTATVTALTQCKLARLPAAGVIRALRHDPEFSELFTSYLVEHNIRMQDDLVDQLLNSTEKRLARLLLTLADSGGKGRPNPAVPKISQEMLAEMIGTSRTRVNFFMNRFRQLGFIAYDADPQGGIKINRSLLKTLLRERPHLAPRG